MADIAQFQSQVSQARQQVEEQRRSLAERQKDIQKQRSQLQQQSVIRSTSPLQRQKFSTQIAEADSQIKSSQEYLERYEQEQLRPAEESIAEYQKRQSDIKAVRKALASGKEYILTKSQRKLIDQGEAEPQMTFTNTLIPAQQMGIVVKDSPRGTVTYFSADVTKQEFKPISVLGEVPKVPTEISTQGVVTAAPERGFFERNIGELETKYLRGDITPIETAKLFTLSAIRRVGRAAVEIPKAPINILKAGKEIIREPSSVKRIPSAVSQAGEEFGKKLRQQPVSSTGSIAGELAFLFGTGFALGKGAEVGARSLGYPKIETRFLTREVGKKGEDVFLRTVAQTEQRNILFPSKQFITPIETQFRLVGDTGEGATRFISASRAATKEATPTLNVLTGKSTTKLKNFNRFATAETGEIVPKELSLSIGQGVRKDIPDSFLLSSVGKTKVLESGDITYFKTAGVGGSVNDEFGFLLSRTRGFDTKAKKLVGTPESSLGLFIKRGAEIEKGNQVFVQRQVFEQVAKTSAQTQLKKLLSSKYLSNVKSAGKSIPFATASAGGASGFIQSLEPTRTNSQFAGTGLYERTEEKLVPSNLFSSFAGSLEIQYLGQPTKSILNTKQETAQVLEQPTKQIPIQNQPPAQRPIQFVTPINTQAQEQLTVQRAIQRLRTSQVNVPKLSLLTSINIPTSKSRKKISKEQARAIIKSWDVYVKSKGKYRKIADNLPRNYAEKFGADYVKKTIAARFKLVGDSGVPSIKKDISYEPDPNIFRNYAIKKNSRVPLKDEWIQKSGSRKEPTVRGARLRSRSEVGEIVGLSRSKKFRFF